MKPGPVSITAIAGPTPSFGDSNRHLSASGSWADAGDVAKIVATAIATSVFVAPFSPFIAAPSASSHARSAQF